MGGRHSWGGSHSGRAATTLAHWVTAHWGPQPSCLFFLTKWKPINLKSIYVWSKKALALKRIYILWGPKGKDTVSFFPFSSNTCWLAPQTMSESSSLRCLSPGREKAPSTRMCRLLLVPGWPQDSDPWGGRATAPDHKGHPCSVSQGHQTPPRGPGPRGIRFLPPDPEARGHGR